MLNVALGECLSHKLLLLGLMGTSLLCVLGAVVHISLSSVMGVVVLSTERSNGVRVLGVMLSSHGLVSVLVVGSLGLMSHNGNGHVAAVVLSVGCLVHRGNHDVVGILVMDDSLVVNGSSVMDNSLVVNWSGVMNHWCLVVDDGSLMMSHSMVNWGSMVDNWGLVMDNRGGMVDGGSVMRCLVMNWGSVMSNNSLVVDGRSVLAKALHMARFVVRCLVADDSLVVNGSGVMNHWCFVMRDGGSMVHWGGVVDGLVMNGSSVVG